MKKKESFGAKSIARHVHFHGPAVTTPLHQALAELLTTQNPQATESVHQRAYWLIEFGAVYVNHKRINEPHHPINSEDVIRVHLNPKRYELDKVEIKKRIISETEDYMIVNKPSGLPMHATLDNLHENLLAAFDFPVHVTHRLDVPTSGLVLVAKTKEYQRLFNEIIFQKRIQKIYQAWVEKPVSLGLHRHFMKVSKEAPKIVSDALSQENTWDECLLKILKCVPGIDNFNLTIKLLTGRTHQIRAQLAFLGAPILGDEMYGGRKSQIFGLHASELSFICPKTAKIIHLCSPPTT